MVDSDYLSYELQMGLTGKTVKSAGIKQPGTVIAINTDKDAPIFKYADFGITADAGDNIFNFQ